MNPIYQVTVNRRSDQLQEVNSNEFIFGFNPSSKLFAYAHEITQEFSEPPCEPRLLDFLELMSVIFYSDKVCKRGYREEWARDINISISLRDEARFRLIEQDLKFALQVLGGDNFSFEVCSTRPREAISQPNIVPARREVEFTDVVLVSGGQDSMIGGVAALQEARRPFFLKVNTKDKVGFERILNRLTAYGGVEALGFQQPTISFPRDWTIERTQRLRSVYFLGLGAAFCKHESLDRLYINENGVMAVHLPLDLSRSSTFSTRTAYPLYLSLFQDICRRWLSMPKFEIRNDHLFRTKGEVVGLYTELDSAALLKETYSCAHAAIVQRTDRQNSRNRIFEGESSDLHCGYCFPCLLRRVSMSSQGLSEIDVKYLANPFRFLDKFENSKHDSAMEGRSAVLGLMGFARKINSSSSDQLVSEYFQIEECVFATGESHIKFVELHRRFAAEIFDYVDKNESRYKYLLDNESSINAAKSVRTSIGSEVVSKAFRPYPGLVWTQPFENQLGKAFNESKLRIQTGIANGQIDEQKIVEMIRSAASPEIAANPSEVVLKQAEGFSTRSRLRTYCDQGLCYPLTQRGK
ncbi:hypothetical protein BH10BDE1_BH10BDE1_23710 [soil metagenome]